MRAPCWVPLAGRPLAAVCVQLQAVAAGLTQVQVTWRRTDPVIASRCRYQAYRPRGAGPPSALRRVGMRSDTMRRQPPSLVAVAQVVVLVR